MNIYGFMSESFQDNETGLTSVIFTPGCNFSCPACHAKKIIQGENSVNEKEVFKLLERRARQYGLKKLTISGGEPTLQSDLIPFLEKTKKIGLEIKLDTNGSNPKVLKEIQDKDLVDYVAMDIKGGKEFYSKISGKDVNIKKIEESINLIQNFPDYEFRTTIVPLIKDKEISYEIWNKENSKKIGVWILDITGKDNHKYFLQSFETREKGEILNDRLSKKNLPKELWKTPDNTMASVYNIIKGYLPRTKMR